MLTNKRNKTAINMRLLLMVQLRSFQMRETVSKIFNCASKHIIFLIVYLHSKDGAAWMWKPHHRGSSEYIYCRWQILSGIPMRRFFSVLMCFNTTEQFIMEDLCVTWRQAANLSLNSIHPSSVDWDKRGNGGPEVTIAPLFSEQGDVTAGYV